MKYLFLFFVTILSINSFADGGGFTGTQIPSKLEDTKTPTALVETSIENFSGGATGT